MANLKAAKAFVKSWNGRGDEKQDTHLFWIELLDKVYEDADYKDHILFELIADKVEGGSNYKDVVINRFTDHAVLVEQKSQNLALDKPEPRFGKMVTPFEQAKHYDDLSAVNDKARWIITCNFQEFWIYDMTKTGKELYAPVVKLKLQDLPKHLDWLDILKTDTKAPEFIDEVEVSKEAGALVGVMYDALKKKYADPDNEDTAKELNKLCVRLVFCLYAEDAGLFNKNNRKVFHDYLAQFDAKGMRKALISLFRVLNQKENERDKYLADDDPLLASFPYVNGGLFEGDVEIPPFDDEIRDILLVKESLSFDWSMISPTIFGAVFESTLNQETRRQGGMHYTSVENIHKVIDPLFLDDLKAELDEILKGKQVNVREKKLLEFQAKMASLKFLDPAAGSGNFLTESYLSLRRLENKIIATIQGDRMIGLGFDGDADWIKVSINQFYGIEINDFAVAVAKTALWIAEAQMYEQTLEILSSEKEFLPLHEYDNIKEGNALRIDWNDVIPASELDYIMGNPPFVANTGRISNNKSAVKGALSDSQREDKRLLFGNDGSLLDYVSCWIKKASIFMEGSSIRTGFVATNSICQGEQVVPLWKKLANDGIVINYAYRTFKWESEATKNATVFVVIVGFSYIDMNTKYLYENGNRKLCNHINAYLVDTDDVFIEKRTKPLLDVPKMTKGCQPTDGGNLIIEAEEYDDFIKKEPRAIKYIKRIVGAKEFINNIPRYCLWLVDADPSELRSMPTVMKRVEMVRNIRLNSPDKSAQRLANTPTLFRETYNPKTYIIVPSTTSGQRRYVPMGFLDDSTISTNLNLIIPDATEYHFGVLESTVHMAWMRSTCGYFGPSYRYSKNIVYNNFPWPNPTPEQQKKIEQTAQGILDARALYPDSSLADLYDELTMPIELRKAHEANDKAVMQAYGFRKDMTEAEIVAELMKMYQKLVDEEKKA